MRALWIDENNDCDWQTAAKHKITACFYSLNETDADVARRLADTRAHNLTAGVYAAWNWMPDPTDGAHFAEWVDGRLKDIIPSATNSYPKVQLNNERHEPSVILSMIRRWRELRPNTDTSWTLEGMQGGWMQPAFVSEVIAKKIRVVPQSYTGPMVSCASDMILRNLLKRGFPETLVSCFYDAAQIENLAYADGFLFTQGRLPQ